MILVSLILAPLLSGLLAWILARRSINAAKWICFAGNFLPLVAVLQLWRRPAPPGFDRWIALLDIPWIPEFGISFFLAADGLSLLMLALTFFLGLIAVACTGREASLRPGLYYFNLMWTIGGIAGVFLALDLFLFYFFWELMLIPMYFLIAIWGHEKRVYAAIKFFIFTQGCSLLLLAGIIALYLLHGAETGVYSFKYEVLLATQLSPHAATWIMLGFFVAFAVKLPAVPLHPWLPDAHVEAPTAGSVLLAGVLLKTGAYGILRFVLPMFPAAAAGFAPVAMTLGAIGIVYGAVLAFAQSDLKRMVAYTSISHLGFVLLGAFSGNEAAIFGAIMQMICHGLSTGALFVIVGSIDERLHTRSMNQMGGLWRRLPRLSGMGLFFALASLGLPGLGNFVGEFLVLLGSYRRSPVLSGIATLGLVFATIYSLSLVQRAFHGEERESHDVRDLSLKEWAMMGSMGLGLLWLGLFPQALLDAAKPSVSTIVAPAERGNR